MFQFLVGRLKMQLRRLLDMMHLRFQFLVGRLKIGLHRISDRVYEVFQFLVGRLKMLSETRRLAEADRVSIPRR